MSNTPLEITLKPWTKEMFERAYTANELMRKAIELEGLLWSAGLINYFSPISVLATSPKIIINSKDTKDMAEKARLLKRLIPDLESSKNSISIWSPYGDCVIVEKRYHADIFSGIVIAVWLETDVQHIPEKFQSEKCKFIPTTETKYTLECSL